MSECVHVVAAVFYGRGEIVIFRRGPGMSGAGFWEFPGGKIEDGETQEQALRREIREEIGVEVELEEKFGENIHQYPTKKIHLHFYWAPIPQQKFTLAEHDAFQYVKPHELDLQILSEADRPIVEVIKKNARFIDKTT